jgi:RNA polymerase sigma factor (sigma-70 family)
MDELNELSTWTGIPAASLADQVFNRYSQRLLAVARNHLSARLRAKVSEEDVVQSALKSFFRRQHEFQFAHDGADGLWGLLVVITLRKCSKWADVYGAEKRAADREVPLDVGSSNSWREAASREPGPEEAALLSDLVERLMGRFGSRQQQIVSLRMQGFELEEIAQQTQSSRRTAARVIAEAKTALRQLLAEDEGPSLGRT